MSFHRTETYRDRPIQPLGLVQRGGWRVKRYSVLYGIAPLERAPYDAMLERAIDDDLPSPAEAAHRPGVAFAIFHQGRGWHYLVLNWWDNENELPQRVYVRPIDGAQDWRPATGGESVCVWDLQVIAFERDAYVRQVLLPHDGPDVAGYLNATFVRPS